MLSTLKLYRCLGHGLKMGISFGYNPQIIFCHFFSQVELSHFYDQSDGFKVHCNTMQFYTILYETFACAYVRAGRYKCA